MEKSFLQRWFCRYIPYQAGYLCCVWACFRISLGTKKHQTNGNTFLGEKKKKSILSVLGAQQFRIWNSPGELSVFFFFFSYLHPQRWNITARKIQSFGNFNHLHFMELFSPLRYNKNAMEDCIEEQFLLICNVSLLQVAGFPKRITECLSALVRWKASAEQKKYIANWGLKISHCQSSLSLLLRFIQFICLNYFPRELVF